VPGLVLGPVRPVLAPLGRMAGAVASGVAGGRKRRVLRTRPGHAYVSVRGLGDRRGDELARAVETAVSSVRGVRWAQVNPVLASVLVSFEDGEVGLDDIAEVVDSVEEAHGETDGEDGFLPEHPADPAAITRTLTALAADAVGIGVGAVGRMLRAPALPVELASAITGVDGVPPVRRLLDRHPGAATVTAVASAALQGLGQGPLGLVVDATHRLSNLGEQVARRRAWFDAEPELCPGVDPPGAIPPMRVGPRPEPAPRSLAERYAEASSLAALGAAAVTLGVTVNPVRTADMLLAGVPRAARLGMEGFGSAVGRRLSGRDVVVMNPAVLRHLDTIDTVVVDAALADRGLAVDELYGSIRAAAHDLVIAGKSSKLAAEKEADLVVAGGNALARSVRELQSEGRVVALVSHRAGTALRAADLGVGVVAPGEAHPPWGADVIFRDPRDVPAVIDATRLARDAGRLAAGLAAAGSLAGGVAALGPIPGAGRRAVTAVQIASLAAMVASEWTAAKLLPRPPAPEQGARTGPDWHALAAERVMAELGTGPPGLEPAGASARAATLAEAEEGRRPGVLQLLASELTNPLTAVLGAGAALSAATGSLVDAGLIGGVIGLDASVGVVQRLRTEAAIARLGRALRGGRVTVVRDGRTVDVDAGEVVTGDVIEVHAGDAVTADARVIDAAGLETDESALTGESLPVIKSAEPVAAAVALADRTSMLYAGTAVAAGRGRAVVVATGAATESRRGAAQNGTGALVVTGVETRLKSLTDKTIPVIVAAGVGLGLNSLMRGAPARDAVTAGVSLAASAVPEGLPFVASVAQAAAAHRLAQSDILVRNPQVLEALGRVDVLCFDKTGTLTEGRLRLTRVSDGETERSLEELDSAWRPILAAALRATPRARPGGLSHPTDQAVVDGAAAAGVRIDEGVPGWKKTGALPFEPGRGYHAVAARSKGGVRISVKGAPEVVLPRCRTWRRAEGPAVDLDGSARKHVDAEMERLARQGLRVLAVAERNGSTTADLADPDVDGLELRGFVGVSDEARSSAAEPLRQLERAGIHIVMITGDHPSTAESVASELGLINGRGVMTGPELDGMDDDELDRVIDHVAVFARVAPAHKVRLVAAFQRADRVVAMTGDGANDAQAIRLAHVGVAFGSRATPAAQAAADIVIARDDLAALIETMVEGRAMWASVRDSLALLLGGNLGEVAFATGAALVTGRPPLEPRQLLTVNLFTDLVPAMAIAVQPPRSARVHLAREGPETSLGGRLARDVALRAAATSAGAYGAWLAARATGSPSRARTVALAALVGTQLGQTMVVGRRSALVVGSSVLAGAGLAAIIQTPGVSAFFGCRPLGPGGWAIAATAASTATFGSVLADLILP
jgi:cation-transporting ATPase I